MNAVTTNIEKTKTVFSAYSPDLDGCVAAGSSREETEQLMREALEAYFEGLRIEGEEFAQPSAYLIYLDVRAG